MRITVIINDQLMEDALNATGLKTKERVIEEGLKLLIQIHKQSKLREWRGRLAWDGDLDQMRMI